MSGNQSVNSSYSQRLAHKDLAAGLNDSTQNQRKILELDETKNSMKSVDKSQLSVTQSNIGGNPLHQQTMDDRNNLQSQLKSPHFFSMSGIPRFGKNWLDNFIPDEELQNVFLTSEVVRNVLMLQCVYIASVYGELLRYKQSFNVAQASQANNIAKSLENSQLLATERMKNLTLGGNQQEIMLSSQASAIETQPLKIGIIGCGQLGTMILTKFLETQNQFDGVRIYVSTRQPHLLRAFQQEFGVWVDYNNERIVAECDLIFLCVLPFQAQQVLKDVRPIVVQRNLDAKIKNKSSKRYANQNEVYLTMNSAVTPDSAPNQNAF